MLQEAFIQSQRQTTVQMISGTSPVKHQSHAARITSVTVAAVNELAVAHLTVVAEVQRLNPAIEKFTDGRTVTWTDRRTSRS